MEQVDWPVHLVISEESLALYQSVFTLLLQLKRAKIVLEESSLRLHHTETMNGRVGHKFKLLRHQLLHFVNSLYSLIMTGVCHVPYSATPTCVCVWNPRIEVIWGEGRVGGLHL